jgi:tetratricopeptide (TPR) repeat protein
MAAPGFFKSKTKGGERITLFVVLPLVSVVTLAIIYFLLREANQPRRESAPPDQVVMTVSSEARLEPDVLLQKLVEAEDLEKQGAWEEARAAFATITNSNRENDRGWGGLGRCLLAEQKYREAAAALDHACRLNVVQPRHFAARGAARRALNDLKRAIRDFRDALSLDPGNALTANAVLFVTLEMNDADLFERTMSKLRQANPGGQARWIMAVAASEMRNGTNESAVAAFKNASEILPPDQYQALAGDRIFSDKRSQDLIHKASEPDPPASP